MLSFDVEGESLQPRVVFRKQQQLLVVVAVVLLLLLSWDLVSKAVMVRPVEAWSPHVNLCVRFDPRLQTCLPFS